MCFSLAFGKDFMTIKSIEKVREIFRKLVFKVRMAPSFFGKLLSVFEQKKVINC
ncbi:unnamed protein product [Larinioides sclopetarius]|uniref:Uncharacterized protein n=1 Tax=Larinioides sclopetarius TaxID=280406 RepID=A0AAV1ZER6_9ARAC